MVFLLFQADGYGAAAAGSEDYGRIAGAVLAIDEGSVSWA
jgi:hypothetical protein